MNWKNLRVNPPTEDCDVVLRNEDGVLGFGRYLADRNAIGYAKQYQKDWGEDVVFMVDEIKFVIQYINLDEIK